MKTVTVIFDWGNTVMVDHGLPGPMVEWETVSWIPGSEDALMILSEQYSLCIASNAGESNTQEMIRALKRVGADRYFRYFFTSRDIGYEKPDVRFFTAIFKSMGITPETCIMIGDNYEKDIVSAKISGMRTVFFNRSKSDREFPLADSIITEMKDLPKAIEQI